MAKVQNNKELSFEDQLKELENIVGRLEGGEIPLEESLVLFEEGVNVYKKLRDKMSKVEIKIQKLTDQMKLEDVEE